jgi:predicted RNA binding protein YcfA (HicA-like mRNA interferase family)
MPRLPRVTAAEAARAIQKIGFTLSRSNGSHMIYHNAQGRRVTIPFHGPKILHPKVLKNILDDAGLTIEEFMALLK